MCKILPIFGKNVILFCNLRFTFYKKWFDCDIWMRKKENQTLFLYFCKVILVDMPQLCSLGQRHQMETSRSIFFERRIWKV